MNNSRPIIFIGITLIFSLTACFHKSDKTGTADDIKNSIICHTPTGDYLITHEEVFHATSKSSGPKGSFTSGYADYRYTIRNIQTGEQISRLITGDREEDLLPIAYDGKQLWCYSADKSVGLHAREPASMQVTITRAQLEKANPVLAGSMNAPTIVEAGQYYSYDPVSNSIILTDLQGNLYSLDPSSLKATLIKKKPAYSNPFSHVHSTNAYMWTNVDISLIGEPRKQIEFHYDKKSEESYLSGEILLEQNTARLSALAAKMIQENKGAIEKIQQRCDSFLKIYPALKDQRQAFLTIRDNNVLNHYNELQSELERRISDSSSKKDDIIRHLTSMILGGDSNDLYILHANNLTDTSSVLITRTAIAHDSSFPKWTTLVPQIYFNPSKGIKRNSMAEVFKSGSPEFDYEWYGVEGNVFVGIKMLFAFGIDINTGKLLWKQQL